MRSMQLVPTMPKYLHAMMMTRPTLGIINQLCWEHEAAIEAGLDWDVKIFCPATQDFPDNVVFAHAQIAKPYVSNWFFGRLIFWFLFRAEYYIWLLKNAKDYDALVLRYNVADPFLLLFCLISRRKFFLVHHTLELPELKQYNGMLARVMYYFEMIFGVFNLRSASGLIGVTSEIAEHELFRIDAPEKSTYVYPNGIHYPNQISFDMRATHDYSRPELVFVASEFYDWHGLDILLNNLKGNNDEFVLHLVGNLGEHDRINALDDSRIVLHGTLNSVELADLYSKCVIGLSSFGLHRKGMKMACTLKVREYLMSGLAVYSGHDDVFPKDFTFYRNGKPDIGEIILYCNSILAYEKKYISESSRKYISKASLLRPLYDWISSK